MSSKGGPSSSSSPGSGLKERLSPRLSGAGRNVINPENLPPESQFAMKTLNVTVDGDSEMPATVKRSDIGVKVLVSLENAKHTAAPKRDAKATQLASEIQTAAQQQLSATFPAPADDCRYLLKVYVVLAAERSLLHKITLGLIGEAQQECLEWFLQSQTAGAQEIVKAGRVGGAGTTQQLCQTLVEKLGVAAE